MQLIFGSMRLKKIDEKDCEALLTHALNKGIRRFHSSTEYESFELFCKTLKAACSNAEVDSNTIRHVIKLAEPSFNETVFNEKRFLENIDKYRTHLQVECIDIIQWMIRGDLDNDQARLESLDQCSDDLSRITQNLKTQNIINYFGCFPYSSNFRQSALIKPWCDILIDYVNPMETDARNFASQLPAGKHLIGIRPLLPLTHDNPTIKNRWSLQDLIEYGHDSPKLEALIVSASSKKHLDELIEVSSRF